MIYFLNKKIHFIGIGGIGMSAIAESLFNMNFTVQGSNDVQNTNCIRLAKRGLPIFIGHNDFSHLDNVDIVIISTAIKPDNPELIEAKRRGIPVGHRSEMLAELMRYKKGIAVAGTHGKTTTTAMIGEVMNKAGLDPSFIIGGIVNSQSSNTKKGESDWLLVEADESDGSFLKLPKMMTVVTNIDNEHMDYYNSFENVKRAFQYFLETTSFYGLNCVCYDHPVVREVMSRIKNRRFVTYGFEDGADLRAINIHIATGTMTFDVQTKETLLKGFTLHMFGRHNILNALAALAIGLELKIPISTIQNALSGFTGVYRRFTKVGIYQGIHIYDDYAHHPIEIAAVLRAAKEANPSGKVLAVFQPHRYSRALDLADEFATCFKDADIVLVTDIYPAGEKQNPAISKDILAQKIKESGHPKVLSLQSMQDIPALVSQYMQKGDMVVGLGAGDISKVMHELFGEKQC